MGVARDPDKWQCHLFGTTLLGGPIGNIRPGAGLSLELDSALVVFGFCHAVCGISLLWGWAVSLCSYAVKEEAHCSALVSKSMHNFLPFFPQAVGDNLQPWPSFPFLSTPSCIVAKCTSASSFAFDIIFASCWRVTSVREVQYKIKIFAVLSYFQ